MGGKGKGKKAKKGNAVPEEDDSVEKFMRLYKKKCNELEVPQCPIIKEKYELFVDEQEVPARFHVWTELGWAGTRTIMDALREVK